MREALTWEAVPSEIARLIKAGADLASRLTQVTRSLRRSHPAMPGYGNVWFNPDTRNVWFALGDSDEAAQYKAWSKALKIDGVNEVRGEAETPPSSTEGPWVRIKTASLDVSDILGPPAQIVGAREGPINALWGGPRPIADLIAGGALGAGAGYGAGWLAESLLPDALASRRLRRMMATLGAAAGATPGAAQAVDNWSQGQSIFAPWPAKQASLLERVTSALDAEYPELTKLSQAPAAMADFTPFIDRDGLYRLIMRDQGIRPEIAAATVGLSAGAAELRGGAQFISPFDIGRVAMGMGSGLISGLIVGRTLGALTGLSPDAQNQLARAGVVAGLLANVVPIALGGR